jgi:hypothetical protein
MATDGATIAAEQVIVRGYPALQVDVTGPLGARWAITLARDSDTVQEPVVLAYGACSVSRLNLTVPTFTSEGSLVSYLTVPCTLTATYTGTDYLGVQYTLATASMAIGESDG